MHKSIEAWLGSGTSCGLWVHGPPGSGRTTAVASALRGAGAELLSVKRIACFPGMSVEEVLEEAAPFFRQLGSDALTAVLRQRAYARAKVSILLEAIRSSSSLLWIDDADLLLRDDGAMEALLEGASILMGSRGRLVITSTSSRPPGLDGTFEAVTVDWAQSPLARMLPAASPDATAMGAALEPILSGLSSGAMAVLLAASALPPEPSRRALRETALALGVELDLHADTPDPRLLELEELGIATIAAPDAAGGPASSPIAVPSPVRRALQERLRARDEATWKSLHTAIAAYHLRVAGRTGSLWPFVCAWRAFREAGHREGVYETQKLFLEALIQNGAIDLSRHVLEETIRVTEGLRRAVALGNLAIIHKNLGEHGKALEIYRRVHREFASMGDQANASRVLHQIGNTQYGMGDLDGALESYEQSLEISCGLGERAVAVATRIQIANVCYLQGDRARALAKYLETLGDARLMEDQALATAVELQVGQIHLFEKRPLEAEHHLRAAEAASRASGDLRSLVKVLEALGLTAEHQRDYTQARGRFDEAVRTALALGDPLEASAAWVLAGQLEEKRLQLADALKCYVSARELVTRVEARSPGEGRAQAEAVEARLRELAELLGDEAFERLSRAASAR